jgi:glycosyltransferase involved in cell wall biosynthesis
MCASSDPLVSVVVPTYDRRQYLAEAVQSVVDQTYPAIELIVVDDHSPTPAETPLEDVAVDSLASVECIRHSENRGGNAARNTGIRRASGEFVAFLDDDDVWRPEKVALQVRSFQQAPPSVGVVFTGATYIDADGQPDRESIPTPDVTENVTRRLLLGQTVIGSFSRVMVRAAAIETVGLPDERFPNWQDREWYLRLSRAYEFEAIREPLVCYRSGDHEQISDDFEARRDETFPLFLEKHRDTAASYGPAFERRFVSGLARAVAVCGLRNGYYRDAVRYLALSLRHDPLAWRTYLYLLLAAGGPVTYRSARHIKHGVDRLRREA